MSPVASGRSIGDALYALVLAAGTPQDPTTPILAAVYKGMPQSFGGQSPTGVLDFQDLSPTHYTLGAGRQKDIWTWTLDVYLDRTQRTAEDAFYSRLDVTDALRTAIQSHVSLNIDSASTNIFAASLDGATSRADYRTVEDVLYAVFHLRIRVVEEYQIVIGA